MEGSTRLVQDLGPAVFTEVLERHNAVLREAFGRHGATERGTQGDSFLVMFPEAPAAVAAAADAQRALAGAEWPVATGVRVRMGIHTGIARLGGDDYVGLDVNRAARICRPRSWRPGPAVGCDPCADGRRSPRRRLGAFARTASIARPGSPRATAPAGDRGSAVELPATRRCREHGREPAEPADQLRRARPRARDAGSPARRGCARHADWPGRRGQDPPCHRDRAPPGSVLRRRSVARAPRGDRGSRARPRRDRRDLRPRRVTADHADRAAPGVPGRSIDPAGPRQLRAPDAGGSRNPRSSSSAPGPTCALS